MADADPGVNILRNRGSASSGIGGQYAPEYPANTLNIPAKTAEGYITAFAKSGLVHRESQDNYINTSLEDVQDSKDAEDV